MPKAAGFLPFIEKLRRWLAIASLMLAVSAATALAQQIGRPLWQDLLYDPVTALAVISDVSDDGTPDVVAGTDGNMVFCIESRTGGQWWSWPPPGELNTGGSVWSVAGIGDVNADGQTDVVVGTASNEIFCLWGGSPEGVGIVLWRTTAGADVWTLAAPGDLNGDSIPDVVAGTAANTVTGLSGLNGAHIWTANTDSDVYSLIAVADLTGDGYRELVAGCGSGKIYCLNGATGGPIWTHAAPGTVWALEAFTDLDGDGLEEILAGRGNNQVECIKTESLAGNRHLWSLDTLGDVRALQAATDLNGDGTADFFCGSADNHVRLGSGVSGEILWETNLGGEVFALDRLPDLNCDGRTDLVCGTAMSTTVALAGRQGSILWQYPLETSGSVRHAAVVADVTEDGVPEVVIGAENGTATLLDGAAGLPVPDCGAGGLLCEHLPGVADATLVLEVLAGVRSASNPQQWGFCPLGDLNRDGQVDLKDAIGVLETTVGR